MPVGTYACLEIKDNGVGIKKEILEKIFEPFYTTKSKGEGTGMGLSVVHGIINSMNGFIEVKSTPGKGTVISAYFPVAQKRVIQKELAARSTFKKGNEHVLIVDDEIDIINLERNILERLGYTVTTCTDSPNALKIFTADPGKFDLIITDMSMPNIPGDILAARLISIRPDIPILLCTGLSETISKEETAFLGIKGFLLKPVSIKALSDKIRETLDKA
jgi:CheY-like chemotaxis protein